MTNLRATIVFYFLMAFGSASLFLTSCSDKSTDGMIIFTRTGEKHKNITWDITDSWRYLPQSQIVSLNQDKPEKSLRVLSAGYYSARSPQISYDGKYMLFAGQKKQNDPWQIIEINLEDLKSRQITSFKENCTDPAYLPGGRLVFSKFVANDTLKASHSLYVCNLDGSNLKRITYNPNTYLASSVLNDGRVLTLGRRIFPDLTDPMLIVMRPDGTKADMFYKSTEESYIISPGVETGNGKIVFIESDKGAGEKGNLIAISYNRPLHSRVNLSAEVEGDFHTVTSLHSGELLVSFRKSEAERYALYKFDPENKTLGKAIYNDAEYDVLEVIEAGQHERPKKLPSEVDMGVKTGLLMCQDINITGMQNPGIISSLPKSSRIEIVGIDSTLGLVDIADDGSFYLKVIADTPFQIKVIDKNGNILSGPSDWIWLRPNERRGCVGCHQDPEIVPVNRVPLAVKKSPVNIPMHINKVVEKKVSLE